MSERDQARSAYVHGATDAREIARLEKQADFTARFTFSHLDVHPGMRVLDLATGVGAMAARLARTFPGCAVTGVDLSAAQLQAARANHGELPYARADATALPFRDACFQRVHCSWLLEHVPAPVRVLSEVRRVLAPGGFCQFIEVDNASFSVRPELPEVTQVMRALNAAQVRAGGDPLIGQVLDRHFAAAGFGRFTIEPMPLVGSQRDPPFLRAFVDEFAEIYEGLDEALGPQLAPTIRLAAAQLRSLLTRPDAELRYTARLATGWR